MSLDDKIKELEHLITVGFVNIGLCPKTGEKKNGIFDSQKEQGKRIEDLNHSLAHNVTWPGLFKSLIMLGALLTAIGSIVAFLFRGIQL